MTPKQIAASSNLGLVQGGGGQGASGGPGVGGMNDSGGVSNKSKFRSFVFQIRHFKYKPAPRVSQQGRF